jgi:hypothetical protein
MQCDPFVPAELNDRAADNWAPLLAIAEVIGGEWPQRAQTAALALSAGSDTDIASQGVQLLQDIRALFHDKGQDRFGSKELCDSLAELEERQWGQWGRQGKPISPNQLAKLLRVYGIESRNLRDPGDSDTVKKGYLLDLFADAFSRYLSPPNPPSSMEEPLPKGNTATSGHQSGDEALFQKVTDYPCSVSENGTNPAPDAGCSGVAFQKPLFQGEEEIWEGPVC